MRCLICFLLFYQREISNAWVVLSAVLVVLRLSGCVPSLIPVFSVLQAFSLIASTFRVSLFLLRVLPSASTFCFLFSLRLFCSYILLSIPPIWSTILRTITDAISSFFVSESVVDTSDVYLCQSDPSLLFLLLRQNHFWVWFNPLCV